MRLQERAITQSGTAAPRRPATAIFLLVVLSLAAIATWLGASRADAIVGGQPAASNEYPWMVKLEDCSGSLIAPDWVLTASHCIVPGQSNAVWIGGVRWGDGERRYWNRSVELAPFATGDQTLLHLSTPSTKPTLRYNATAAFGTVGPMTAVGYGESCATCTDEILRSVANLPAVDSGDGFITTGVGGSNRTICLGDSGGPLVKRHDGHWLQVGVHSYTIRPNCTGLAGHTATAQFASDIERVTGRAPLRPQPPQIDTQRPNPPRGLTMSADGRTLRWIAAVDNVGVSHYTIHRSSNGTVGPQIGQTLTTTYRDTSAQPGVRYTYAVKARDAAGNVSWRSNIARTPSTDGPRCTKQAVGTDVSLSVSGMTADRYAIRANGTWVSSRPGGQTSYIHSGGRVGDHYVVRYYQPDRTDIVCTDQATVPVCSVAARNGGVQVTVSNMAADRYAVRVDGRWVASVDDPNAGFFHPGGSTADRYVVRYYKPTRIDLACTR